MRFRAAGSGWAAAAGRLGGIAAPSAVALLLQRQSGFDAIFAMFAGVMAAVVVLLTGMVVMIQSVGNWLSAKLNKR